METGKKIYWCEHCEEKRTKIYKCDICDNISILNCKPYLCGRCVNVILYGKKELIDEPITDSYYERLKKKDLYY